MRLAWAVSAGACFLLAVAVEARVKTFKLECTMVAQAACFWVTITNTTGREISLGDDDIRVTFCSPSDCETVGLPQAYKDFLRATNRKLKPGESFRFCFDRTTGNYLRNMLTSCTVNQMGIFEPGVRRDIPNFTRIKPPGPPQPGLLEDSPGFSRQSPSSVGTPKPSAPPPPVFRDSLR